MLKNYEQGFFKIRNQLLLNEKIRKLLYYNDNNCLNKQAPTEADLLKGDYIITIPMESLSKASVANLQGTFISINIPTIKFEDQTSGGVIKIALACAQDIWQLENNQLRLFQLAEEVVNQLNYEHCGFAGQIILDSMELQIYTANYIGYDLTFTVIDETKSTVEF